jgi:ABC-type multidrug transport system fused ATPase/permease subunit
LHTIYTLQDMDDVDFLLSMSMTEFGSCMFQLLSTLIFLAVIQPWILVGIAPLAVIYWVIQRFYRRSYIELQRLDAVSRSPIYSHFSESLAGVETIRAYGQAGRFESTSDRFVDSNHRQAPTGADGGDLSKWDLKWARRG